MTKKTTTYAVKLLSGVNEGASADLQHGSRIEIGSSSDCDIIFSGARVADHHLALQLNSTKIRATPLAQPVYVDGKDIGLHEVTIQTNQLITVGDIDFTIADKNQPWPTFNARTKRLVIDKKSTDTPRISRKSDLLRNPWLWGTLSAMLLANIHYLTRDNGGVLGLVGITKTAEEKLSSAMNTDMFSGLSIKNLSNGSTQVNGYVATPSEKLLAEKKMEALGNNVSSRIFVDTELETNAQAISQALGEKNIRFSTLKHGRLKATGLAGSRQTWLEVKENIRSDVEGVQSINDDDVNNLNEIFSTLKDSVSKEKFAKRISLQTNKGIITVKGKLTESERTRWKEIKTKFINKTAYAFKFDEYLRTPDSGFTIAIQSVSVGDVPFVVSKDGNKYFKGSHVGSNHYIEAIKNDHILLKNSSEGNNISFPIYFGKDNEG